MVTDDIPVVNSEVLESHDIADHGLAYCELDIKSDHSHVIGKPLSSVGCEVAFLT